LPFYNINSFKGSIATFVLLKKGVIQQSEDNRNIEGKRLKFERRFSSGGNTRRKITLKLIRKLLTAL